MNASNPYFDDVLSTHVLIRAWLSGEATAPQTTHPQPAAAAAAH